MIFFRLFIMFFRIGLFGFGGGMAMLPLIFQSLQDFGIMSSEEFARLVALSQVTPGPIAINAATYVGFLSAGAGGALAATIGVALPSFILVLIAVKFMDKFKDSKGLEGVLYGVRPATVGLIAAAVIFVAETSLVNGTVFSSDIIKAPGAFFEPLPCLIFLATVVLFGKFKVNPMIVIVIMAVLGALLCG